MILFRLMVCLLGLFQINNITTKNSLQTYYEDVTIQRADCQILSKGFYIILSSEITPPVIHGDYHLVIGKNTFDAQQFVHHTRLTNQQINEMESKIEMLDHTNIYYLTVDSMAVYIPVISSNQNYLFGFSLSNQENQIIQGENIRLDICNLKSSSSLVSSFTAIDLDGSDISDQIVFETNYSEQEAQLGRYYLLTKAKDLTGKMHISIFTIDVIDIDAPTITIHSDLIKIDIQKEKSVFDIINENTTITDLNSNVQIKIDHDAYTTAKEFGTYEVIFHAIDEFQNQSEKASIFIQLVDEVPPVIQLKNQRTYIASSTVLLNEEIIGLFSITDNSNSTTSLQIVENTCTGAFNQQYQISVLAKDSYGNEATQAFDYFLIEHSNPIIEVQQGICVQKNTFYSNQELLSYVNHPIPVPIEQEHLFQYLHLIDIAHPAPLDEIVTRYQIIDEFSKEKLPFQFESNYTASPTIGSYWITIYYIDSLNQDRHFTDVILVRDFVNPIVNVVDNEMNLDLCSDWNVSDIQQHFSFADNLDEILETIEFIGLEQLIEEGDYLIGCRCIDSSTNQSNLAYILIHTYESIHEEIVPITIKVKENNLSEQELASLFLKENEIKKGYLSLSVKSNYYHNKDGIYQAVLQTTYDKDRTILYYFKIQLTNQQEENQTPTYIYITIGVCISLLMIGIILYRKRANFSEN